ncbi:FAD-dependent oxidoreductase [Micromonospora sp. NPDC094482]|uniref:protoporphyrinogen/coproporphyrinogen oxidase n=1 Tax=Micromonospora sp. NPDC094482 TaxID=3155081 RepID=UPI00332ADD2D
MVGAGVAGLAAAHRLTSAGLDVVVLEAEVRPGGRLSTLETSGGPMERGAQFLSTGYTVIPELVSVAGLADQVVPVSGRSMVLLGGRSHAFDTMRPGTLVRGGTVRARDALPALRGMMRARRLAHRDIADIGQWADLDQIDGQSWSTAVFGTGLTARLLNPTVLGLYFLTLSANSGAIPGALAAFQARRAKAVTVRGGLGRLAVALARPLNVEYGVRVERVWRDGTGGAVLATNRGRRRAASVVLATPAKPTTEMLAEPTPQEAAVLSVPYSRGLLIGLALGEQLAAGEVGDAYGVLASPGDTTPLAAVAVRSRADAGSSGDLLTVMLRPSAVDQWWSASDRDLHGVAVAALSPLLPELKDRVTGAHIVRWEQAMPAVPTGHVAAVTAYRRGIRPTDPVVLAGDYLGFPWTDSAAFNGRWAADHLLSR